MPHSLRGPLRPGQVIGFSAALTLGLALAAATAGPQEHGLGASDRGVRDANTSPATKMAASPDLELDVEAFVSDAGVESSLTGLRLIVSDSFGPVEIDDGGFQLILSGRGGEVSVLTLFEVDGLSVRLSDDSVGAFKSLLDEGGSALAFRGIDIIGRPFFFEIGVSKPAPTSH